MPAEQNPPFNRDLFEEFASKRAAALLTAANTEKNRMEKLDATLLEIDITKFVVAGDFSTEEIMKVMNAYHEAVGEIVNKYDGDIIGLNSDSVLCYFQTGEIGADAENAVRAAIELKTTASERLTDSKIEVGLSMGINSGLVGIGIYGSKYRRQLGCFGQPRNFCGRLMSMNKSYDTDIILSQFTQERLGPYIDLREIDKIAVAGLKEFVKIFEVISSESNRRAQ